MFKLFTVYILECADGRLYIGVTNNIERRFNEHQTAYNPNCWTARRLPVKLVYQESFKSIKLAIAREKQLKRWSLKKKQALIAGDLDLLKRLASCRNESTAMSRLRST
ncbi:MAG: GIY-YIG nuclease family protein [Bacteroidia bacterium]|jgi:putative endonuclease|nr:GIY-YIG nuclease family protein [Bacteroidia bacterium]